MAKITNTKVSFFDEAVIGSKYPMSTSVDSLTSEVTDTTRRLASAPSGSGHDNFLKGIVVTFDMTFSQKAWPEAQRYHFLEFVSSTSTMHRLERMDIESCCNKYVTASAKANLERCRDEYLRTKSKEDFLTMIYNIPSGFELRAKMVTNYQQLKTIYHQRRTHRLPDWQVFCDWVEGLPHSDLITGKR